MDKYNLRELQRSLLRENFSTTSFNLFKFKMGSVMRSLHRDLIL